jgi:hypothetical protein
MFIPQRSTQAEGIDSIKSVQPLPGRVFNAENLTITKEGRLFVTGSEAVYERTTEAR